MRIQADFTERQTIFMSPLIDCIFLLLIFFLVTTMLKRWDHEVPLNVGDETSARLEGEQRAIAIKSNGDPYQMVICKRVAGHVHYYLIKDLEKYISNLDARVHHVVILSEDEAPSDEVIHAYDLCRELGFENTRIQLLGSTIR